MFTAVGVGRTCSWSGPVGALPQYWLAMTVFRSWEEVGRKGVGGVVGSAFAAEFELKPGGPIWASLTLHLYKDWHSHSNLLSLTAVYPEEWTKLSLLPRRPQW